ncbi:immunoglobulin-like domain-containing protein [Filibacter tadaridae]|uniref:Bacterial Ig-like domain-containing protein n=1 Tax=Filibacter tadaridae TaxID=2483811 RepID=A0A3P5WR32_9BACL|nr:immunoglobulin-like domain-containing protein [Filibacter tadaridae]VDC21620.1 hypothetical protein FILTAD_00624 [Filibacter tadaridae]
MKRFIIFALILILTGCGKDDPLPILPDPTPDQVIQSVEEGLSLELLEDSYEGPPSEITTIIRNDSSIDFSYGEFYTIEVSVDGQWYMMTYSDAVFLRNQRFKDTGHLLLAGGKARQTFSIEALGLKLLPGEYRLVKSFSTHVDPFYEVSVAATFSVK